MSSNRRTVRGLACVAVIATALAGCGSSSHSSASSVAHSSTSAASGATHARAAFTLGTICSCSGVQAALFAKSGEVSTVWADSVNASGGINGHPVHIIVKDDGGDPTRALQDVKELIGSDHVMAIVGDSSLADDTWAGYVTAQGVPVIGGFAPSVPFLTDPDFFPAGADVAVTVAGTAAMAKQAGKKKFGVMFCAETPLCAQVVPLAQGAAALSGLGFTSQKVSSTAPSYAAPCLSFKGQGVDALGVADNGVSVQRIVDGCAQQGYTPTIASQTTTAVGSWLSDHNFNGALLSSSNPDYTDASIPAVKAFLTAVAKYAPGLQGNPEFTYDTFYPWIAGQLFAAAATAGKLTPTSTPADVKHALYLLKNETLGGLAPPLNFTPGKPAFPACYFTVTIHHSTFASLNAGKPTCLNAAQATALAAALRKLG